MALVIEVLIFVIGLAVSIVSIVAAVTIVSKAGYSGWWILTQFVPVIVAWLLSIIVINVVVNTGQPTLGKLFGADLIVIVIYFAAFIVQWGFFIAFAFSDWPALQVNRFGPGRRGPGSGTFGPSGLGPMGGAPGAFAPPPPVPLEGQPAGWYRSGALGAGEQSYWDGTTWTARRVWQNGAWVDLPLPVVETAEAVEAGVANVGPDATA